MDGEIDDEENVQLTDKLKEKKIYKYTEFEVQKYRRDRFLELNPLDLTQLNGTDFQIGAGHNPESIDQFLQQQEREIRGGGGDHDNFENIPTAEQLLTNIRAIDQDIQIARSLRIALFHFGYGDEVKPPPMKDFFADFSKKYKEYVRSKVPFRYLIKFLYAFCEFITVVLMYNQHQGNF